MQTVRKMLVGVSAGGLLVGGVYGAAASLGTLSGQDIAASDASVIACDADGFDIDWITQLDGSTSPAVQRISAAEVTGLHANCGGRTFRVRLTSDPDGAGAGAPAVIYDQTFPLPTPLPSPLLLETVPGSEPAVSAVNDLHVTQVS